MWIRILWLLSFVCSVVPAGGSDLGDYVWPTPSTAFVEGRPFTEWVQATAAGHPESGLFGCVRNDGNRFHEGIDIAPVLRRHRGEATDPVFAFADGVVAYVNRQPGRSGYGRYIILEHKGLSPAVYSLYAHLARVGAGLEVGAIVAAGEEIGTLGRSAGGYTIPRERAHLHFEIGVRLSDRFQAWFDRQDFGSPNFHGMWNGMNLVGLDPLDFFRQVREGRVRAPEDYLLRIPMGAILRVATNVVPDYARRYPGLVDRPLPEEGLAGWEIAFSGWGFPLRLTPLHDAAEETDTPPGTIEILAVDPEELARYACRNFIRFDGAEATLGRGGTRILQLLFDFH